MADPRVTGATTAIKPPLREPVQAWPMVPITVNRRVRVSAALAQTPELPLAARMQVPLAFGAAIPDRNLPALLQTKSPVFLPGRAPSVPPRLPLAAVLLEADLLTNQRIVTLRVRQ
jgi:hypothetical protein